MDDIFCKIIRGEIPSVKIWENEDFLAILDAFPNREGQTLVIPKKHYESDITEVPDEVLEKLFVSVKEVSGILKKGLNVEKVALVVEGLGVPHLHVKLFPLYEGGEGYLTTELGPQKNIEELNVVAQRILN